MDGWALTGSVVGTAAPIVGGADLAGASTVVCPGGGAERPARNPVVVGVLRY